MSRQTRMSCSDDATKLAVGRDRRHGRRSASVFRRRRRTLRIRASRPQEACDSGACGRCTMAAGSDKCWRRRRAQSLAALARNRQRKLHHHPARNRRFPQRDCGLGASVRRQPLQSPDAGQPGPWREWRRNGHLWCARSRRYPKLGRLAHRRRASAQHLRHGRVVRGRGLAPIPFRGAASFKAIAEYRVAQRIPIAAPLVWSGFLYARWKYGVDFYAASPEAAVGATSTPVLLIHGLDDKNTPPLHSQIIASRRRSNIDLWLVPDAGHTGAFQTAPGEFRYQVLSWLSNHS